MQEIKGCTFVLEHVSVELTKEVADKLDKGIFKEFIEVTPLYK